MAEDGVAQFPWFAQSDELQVLVEAIYAGGWVLPGFSWPDWADSEEARHLRDEPGGVETALIRQLGKLLTTIVRADRFSDGAIAQAIDSGLMQRVLQRVAELALATANRAAAG